jgi:hypothetical protein
MEACSLVSSYNEFYLSSLVNPKNVVLTDDLSSLNPDLDGLHACANIRLRLCSIRHENEKKNQQ